MCIYLQSCLSLFLYDARPIGLIKDNSKADLNMLDKTNLRLMAKSLRMIIEIMLGKLYI